MFFRACLRACVCACLCAYVFVFVYFCARVCAIKCACAFARFTRGLIFTILQTHRGPTHSRTDQAHDSA